jgi:UDP-3-O-[3-hydroxymyristoyl] glucosamine N-acyltransferase
VGRRRDEDDRPPALTTGRLAELVGGRLVGADDIELVGVAPLDRAGPDELALLASREYLPHLAGTRAGAVLLGRVFENHAAATLPHILVDEPHRALARVLQVLYPAPPPAWGVHPTAQIGPGTQWEDRVAIGPRAVLGKAVRLGRACSVGAHAVIAPGVIMGDACRIEAHVVVHAGTVLGNRVRVRSGARVGGTGFGFVATDEGHQRVPQVGRCTIADDVEIGANTTVDRGTLGDTAIGAGTKIDNLVQIAHNVRVGARCIIMAQVGIAGSVVVEDDAMLAGQAGLADHLTVGTGARVAAQSGVIGDIAPGATVSGYPARDHRSVLRQTAALERLARLVGPLERLTADDAP